MCSLEPLKIDLKGADEGLTKREFDLDNAFFEAIDAQEVRQGRVHVALNIQRSGSVFNLVFRSTGTVTVPCDLCLDEMEQPVEAETSLTAKLGTEYSEEDDVITVDENEGILDVAWLIYESIALAIPIKHVHAPGKCNAAMTQRLEELSAARSSDGDEETAVDPRWSALKNLKIEQFKD
ncbi:MAG: DUF177 domain-containing protein [Prevotella sp.]|nr:DUF177 domain-containing protein [Prevotella sp.]